MASPTASRARAYVFPGLPREDAAHRWPLSADESSASTASGTASAESLRPAFAFGAGAEPGPAQASPADAGSTSPAAAMP